MYLPDEIWMEIIKYQMRIEDYNPSIINRQYKKVLTKYNKNWIKID
jgi:hypothetical protein